MLRKIVLFLLGTLLLSSIYADNNKITILLDWFVNPDHAPIMIADYQGFFQRQGLNVRIIAPADPSDPLKLVAAKQADIGVTYQPDFTVAVSQGLPLVKIGTLVDQPLNSLIVLKDGPIKTLADLKGKRIGYSGSSNQIMLRTMLNSVGLTLSDVQLVNLHFNETQALMAGQIDAFTGGMRNFEPIEMELAGHPARVFAPENAGMPAYDELIFVANRNKLNNPNLVKFMQAIKEATLYLKAHPQACWDEFAKENPALNNQINRRAWFASLPYFASNPGKLDAAKYNAYTAFLTKANMVHTMPPVSNYAVELSDPAANLMK